MSKAKKKRGRPVKLKMPPKILDTPENIAYSYMQRPPKKEWRYLETKK